MATISVQQITLAGLNRTLSDASAGGDKCAPGDNVFIQVHNGSGGSITVTVDSVRPSDQGTDENLVVTIADAAVRRIGPLPANRFAGSDGLVSWTYSSHTDVDVAAIKV